MKVVYAMTRNLYDKFLPTLRSLLEHNDPEKVYIMAEDPVLPIDLPEVCEVVDVSGQTYFTGGPNMDSIFTYMAMMRCTYADLFPNEDRLLQLDIDTIICDDLTPIWEMDLEGKWIGACREHLGTYKPFGPDYYNVGVSVHNLKQIRKDGIIPKLVDCLNAISMQCTEQDAFNRYGQGKFADFEIRYNECFCCGYTENPAVVHFAGVPDWYDNAAMFRFEYLQRYK